MRFPDHKPEIRNQKSTAFTLVELLVVITIIGILIALLLPAVQAAREAARQVQCKNHLKQLGLAALHHEQTHGYLPTGGWGYLWVGDADRGFDKRQPGGWLYNILPYIEQEALYDMPADGQSHRITARQRDGAAKMGEVPISAFICPSRRSAILYPRPRWQWPSVQLINANTTPVAAACDYAANAGDFAPVGFEGPYSLQQGDGNFNWSHYLPFEKSTGVNYLRSEVKIADIRDGTSATYLVGEKYINADHYFTGMDSGDDSNVYEGHGVDSLRWTSLDWGEPRQDQPGVTNYGIFGSAHANGFHMAFCDGSVQMINYSIDLETHRCLGNRDDGKVVDAKMY